MVPEPIGFEGRPQLAARLAGQGDGRHLILNGHIDVVDVEPRGRWTTPPHRATLRDGRVYGRGACDMKGGIAAMVVAAEAVARLGVLGGDLTVCTVTDEESTGAGGLAAVSHGVRGDGTIVTEPTGLAVWRACRGTLIPTVTVEGRPGHAGVPQPDWRDGGAVNAIEKMLPLLEAVRRFEAGWRAGPEHRHPALSEGSACSASCTAATGRSPTRPAAAPPGTSPTCPPMERPTAGPAASAGRSRRRSRRPRPVTPGWSPTRRPWPGARQVPAAEVAEQHPLVQTLAGAIADAGRRPVVAGLDNWHDGATFTRLGDTPAVCFGPGDIGVAHAVDEHVPVAEMVDCAKLLAVAALRFCHGSPG